MPMSSTNRALIAIAALVLLVAAGTGVYLYRLHGSLSGIGGEPPDILSQLPPDAPVVVYIDVATLRKSQGLFGAFGLGIDKPASPAGGPILHGDSDYDEFVRGTGFDYTRDLDRAAIALWPANVLTPSKGPASPTGGLGENRVLAIAEGRFDESKIKAYALRTGKVATRGAQSLYTVPGNPPTSFAFLSPTRIALASGPDAENLLAAPNSTARDPAMQARIDRVAGAPIFAVARTDTLPNSFYANFRNSPQLERLARSVRGLTLAGQPQSERIDMALDAECDSMTNALELSTLLDGFRVFGSMALADPKTRRSMTKEQAAFLTAVANQVKVTQQDRWVRLTLAIAPAMLTEGASGPHARGTQPGDLVRRLAEAPRPEHDSRRQRLIDE